MNKLKNRLKIKKISVFSEKLYFLHMEKAKVAPMIGFLSQYLWNTIMANVCATKKPGNLLSKSCKNHHSVANFYKSYINIVLEVLEPMRGSIRTVHLENRIKLKKSVIDPMIWMFMEVINISSEKMANAGEIPYAYSKLSREEILNIFAILEKLKIRCLWYFNLPIPRESPDNQQVVLIQVFISLARDRMAFTMNGEGSLIFKCIYMDDIINIYLPPLNSDVEKESNQNKGIGTNII